MKHSALACGGRRLRLALPATTLALVFSVCGHAASASAPPTPSWLTATPASAGRVVLTWDDNSDHEIGFRIDREPGGPSWPVIVGANERMFTDSPGLGQFTYRVSAIGRDGVSDPSSPTSIHIRSVVRPLRAIAGPGRGPSAGGDGPTGGSSSTGSAGATGPSSVSGSGVVTPVTLRLRPPAMILANAAIGRVDVEWKPSPDLEGGFELTRERFEGRSWVESTLIELPAATTSYTDLLPAGVYRYRVRVIEGEVATPHTSWVVAAMFDGPTVPSAPAAPGAPESVAAADIGNGRAMVTWRDGEGAEQGFSIERDPAFAQGLVQVGPGARTFIDPTGNGTFRYRVRGFNGSGVSAFSDWAQVVVASGSVSGTGTSGGGTALPGLSPSSGGTVSSGPAGGGTGSSGGGGTTGGGAGGGGGGGGSGGGGTGGEPTSPPAGGSGPGAPSWGGGSLIPGLPIDAEGWTIFNPSPDSRIVYVSSSTGNDANSGLSPAAPKRTISAALPLIRDKMPDWLLLKRGDQFPAPMYWSTSGRSGSEPAVLGAYGTGPRPMVVASNAKGLMILGDDPINHVAIVGIHFKDATWNGQQVGQDQPVGIQVIRRGKDLLIEDVRIEGFAHNLVVQGWNGKFVDVKVRRSLLLDGFTTDPEGGGTNSFFMNYDGLLLEENVFDTSDAHWAMGRRLSHNVYATENNTERTIVRGNIARNAGRANFSIRSGGLVENNLSVAGAQHMTAGISYATVSNSARFVNNVLLETRNNGNGQPLGRGISAAKSRSVEIIGNIIAHGTLGGDHRAVVIYPEVDSVRIEQNVIFNWTNQNPPSEGNFTIDLDYAPTGPVVIVGNEVQQLRPANLIRIAQPPQNMAGVMTVGQNRYSSPLSQSLWFWRGNQVMGLSQWGNAVADGTSVAQLVSYPDPGRTVGTYWASVLRASNASTEDFFAAVREQSRANWRSELTAPMVNAYIRAGFGR